MKRKAGVVTLPSIKKLLSFLRISKVQGALYSLFHHTNVEAFAKIVAGKGIWMSRIDQMNDGMEKFPDADKTYVFSLSAVPTENVAMWVGYGVPRKEAIRVRFSGKALERICQTNKGRVEVLPIKGGQVHTKPVCGTASLQYVGYVSRSGGRVHVRDTIYQFASDKTITREELMNKCGSFIKLLGWRYEQEVRFVITLDEKIDAEKIQIELGDVVEGVLTYKPKKRKDSKGMPSVIVGPWSSRVGFIKEFHKVLEDVCQERGIDIENRTDVKCFLEQSEEPDGVIRESEYKGKISLGHCVKCEKEKPCRCCYYEPSELEGDAT